MSNTNNDEMMKMLKAMQEQLAKLEKENEDLRKYGKNGAPVAKPFVNMYRGGIYAKCGKDSIPHENCPKVITVHIHKYPMPKNGTTAGGKNYVASYPSLYTFTGYIEEGKDTVEINITE